jgi:hypothetical protein
VPTLVATAGSVSANSYASDAEAEMYCATRKNAAEWETETDDDERARALIDATRDLDALTWPGERASETQALAWPRRYVTSVDSPSGAYLDAATIPAWLRDATCELALQYLKAGDTDLAADDTSRGLIRTRVDIIEKEWAPGYQRASGMARWPRVQSLIQRYVAGISGSVRLVR